MCLIRPGAFVGIATIKGLLPGIIYTYVNPTLNSPDYAKGPVSDGTIWLDVQGHRSRLIVVVGGHRGQYRTLRSLSGSSLHERHGHAHRDTTVVTAAARLVTGSNGRHQGHNVAGGVVSQVSSLSYPFFLFFVAPLFRVTHKHTAQYTKPLLPRTHMHRIT